jgi:large subunit ribosomal protein L10
MKKVGTLLREKLVHHLKDGVDYHENIFLVSYSGVSSVQLSSLRKNLRAAGANVFVSKNRIAKFALKELKLEELSGFINGQTAFIWSNTDSVEISKALVKFSELCKGFVVRGCVIGEEILGQAEVEQLSKLPSKTVLQAQLLGTILAPLTRLAYALNAKSRDLLSIMKQLSEQKGGK